MRPFRKKDSCFVGILIFVLLCLRAAAGNTEPITSLSAIQTLHSFKKFYFIPNFKMGGNYNLGEEADYEWGGTGGVTLESLGVGPLRVAYIAVGNPIRDEKGKIINAVVINSYIFGDSTNMYYFWHEGNEGTEFSMGAVVGPGGLIDTEKYYVVFVDGLGLWGASKPSDGLGMKFPNYSYYDIVQANYRLLKDELNVAKIRLASGVSMGGSLCYVWAILHPNFVEAIMPIGGNTSPDPVARWIFRLMTAAIQSDPVWLETKGNYYHLPKERRKNKGIMFGWSILDLMAYDFKFRVTLPWEDVKKGVFSWEPEGDEGEELKKRATDYDMNDLLYRNRTCDLYHIDGQLHRIKANTLVIHMKNDQWLIYPAIEKSTRMIKGAKLIGFESPLAHYAVFRAPHMAKKEVLSFFKEIGMVPGSKESGTSKGKSLFEK